MSKGQSLQDPFLNALRKDRVAVAIFLVNGIKLQGYIESFDRYVVLLKNNVSQMVYKHAISTIVPIRTQQRQGFDTPRQGFDGTRQAFDNRSFDNRGFGAERNFDNRGFDSARQNFSRYPQSTGFGYKKNYDDRQGFEQGFERNTPAFADFGTKDKDERDFRAFKDENFDEKFNPFASEDEQ